MEEVMRESIVLWTNVVLVAANIFIIVLWYKSFRRVGELQEKENKHFKISQINFELAVQEQKRNQAESDVTQLRIKKAEFEADNKFIGDVKQVICDRLKQYEKCRTPEIVDRIKKLKEERGKVVNSTK